MGGEPLLHPNLTELLKTARNYFDKKTVIAIITNGILLPKQSGCFWQSCAEHDIQIYISKYPIEIDINTIYKYSTQYHIKCEYYAHSILSHSQFNVNTLPEEGEKAFKMMKMPFDLNGQQNIIDNFKYCGFANSCLTLRDGRLYTCAPAAHAWLFNGYFGQKLNISREDSIDIYNAKSKNEILEFLASPIPFCRYCNVKGRSGDHKWGISKKILTEWV
jgi:molybdenum cofactor biosynthesis enzyme MoaA